MARVHRLHPILPRGSPRTRSWPTALVTLSDPGDRALRPRLRSTPEYWRKSPFPVSVSLYARVMARTRYGMTFLGLIGSGGAGVYLGVLPAGLVALVAAAVQA